MTEGAWQMVIGVLALVVAIATLWLVIVDRAERKRRIDSPRPDATGSATLNNSAPATHRVWLENTGGGTARVLLLRPHKFEWAMMSEPLPTVLPAGQRIPVEVRTSDFDAAWLHIIWVSSEDKRFVRVDWFPLNDQGPLHQLQLKDFKGKPRGLDRIGWLRRRREVGRRVGPGAMDGRMIRNRDGGQLGKAIEGAIQPPQ